MKTTLRLGAAALDVDLTRRPDGTYVAVVEGESFDVRITGTGTRRTARIAGTNIEIEFSGGKLVVEGTETPWAVLSMERDASSGPGADHRAARIRPPMAGKIESLRVKVGQLVHKGDVLFVLEAMKMQNDVKSPVAGIVRGIHAQSGDAVEASRVILDIEGK